MPIRDGSPMIPQPDAPTTSHHLRRAWRVQRGARPLFRDLYLALLGDFDAVIIFVAEQLLAATTRPSPPYSAPLGDRIDDPQGDPPEAYNR